jgi:pimeloyl-ACP methyl ester carboxylesterase
VLGGAEDRIVPPETGRRIAGRIPGAERVEIPETGHAFYMEEPEATNAALHDFLHRN